MTWKLMVASAVLSAVRVTPWFGGLSLKPSIEAGNAARMELNCAPINPDWILEGQPFARASQQSASGDGAAYTAVWDCTAGTFRWYFGWDETVVILEGEVHVTDENGVTQTLRQGDVGYFVGGTWATWKVDNYVRKVAFMRRTLPKAAAIVYRASDIVRNRISAGLKKNAA